MAGKIKTGRRAGDADRSRAAELVELYRIAQASPGGSYCLNPEDDYEVQTYIDANDPELLLWALEQFAENGTFANLMDFRPLLMGSELEQLRSGGMTYEDAVAALAEKHNTSESTITRMVRRNVKT